MDDKQRVEIPGAIYYLQAKGMEQRELFSEQHECRHFRRLLGVLCEESGGGVLGYCILPESIHLVLRTPPGGKASSVSMVQWLMKRYSQYYNRAQERSGAVFHNHCAGVLIEPNHYLLPVIYKLHHLPVTRGLVAKPSAYPWSSHRDYLSFDPPDWLDRNEVFQRIVSHRAMQVRRYELFIEENVQPDVDWLRGVHPEFRALASDEYIEKLFSRNSPPASPSTIDMGALVAWVAQEYGLSPRDLTLWRRHRLLYEVRAVIAVLAMSTQTATIDQVARYFACDVEAVENGIRALNAHRSMFLYGLQIRLDQWLSTESFVEHGDALHNPSTAPLSANPVSANPVSANQEALNQEALALDETIPTLGDPVHRDLDNQHIDNQHIDNQQINL